MRIWQFVITGGPCGGKSTGLSVIEQILTKKGYKVLTIPETATEVIYSGICPNEFKSEEFEGLVIDRQLNKEETTWKIAHCYKKDVVILYDRGVLDTKAYIGSEIFQKILEERGLTEIEVRDKYDGVFHLVTAADGAEEFYTLANNKARTETPEQARELDKKTNQAWVGHPHLRVIDNSTGFREKIDRLINGILGVMGMPTPIENERKFLIEKPDEETLKQLRATKLSIFQAYLTSDDPMIERRIRQRGDGKTFSYYYTEKQDLEVGKRLERESKISQREYVSLLPQAEKIIRKDRYCFLYRSQYFELDIFPEWDKEAMLEIELTNETETIEIPDYLQVIKEVTEDKNFYNSNLAK